MHKPTIIRNTPSCLIPKELFKEEKINEYWNVLTSDPSYENIGKDDLSVFYLLYPKPKDEYSIHEISFMYKNFIAKFPNQKHSICINVYDEGFNLLAIKDHNITYTGYFQYSESEEIIYHLANISRHFFANVSEITFYYQQLSTKTLKILNNYYEMKHL